MCNDDWQQQQPKNLHKPIFCLYFSLPQHNLPNYKKSPWPALCAPMETVLKGCNHLRCSSNHDCKWFSCFPFFQQSFCKFFLVSRIVSPYFIFVPFHAKIENIALCWQTFCKMRFFFLAYIEKYTKWVSLEQRQRQGHRQIHVIKLIEYTKSIRESEIQFGSLVLHFYYFIITTNRIAIAIN